MGDSDTIRILGKGRSKQVADGGYNDIVHPCVSEVGHCPCSSGIQDELTGDDGGTPTLAISAA